MNIEKTIKSLEKNRFKVTYFEQAEDAAKYLDEAIKKYTLSLRPARSKKVWRRPSGAHEMWPDRKMP